jgi:hypothetical protein
MPQVVEALLTAKRRRWDSRTLRKRSISNCEPPTFEPFGIPCDSTKPYDRAQDIGLRMPVVGANIVSSVVRESLKGID